MTRRLYAITQAIRPMQAIKPVLVGGGIGLVLISIFLPGVNDVNPAWGKYWMIRPLIIVPLAGAGGGLAYYLMDRWRRQFGWNRTVVLILSGLAFITGLWLGAVLGLDGTYWN